MRRRVSITAKNSVMKKRSLHSFYARQHGSIAVLIVASLSVMLLMLAIADIGFAYVTKREFQKTADLAAMAGASQLIAEDGTRSCSAASASSQANADLNLNQPAIPKGYEIQIECGQWNPFSQSSPFIPGVSDTDSSLNAVRVTVSGTPFGFFMPTFLGRSPEILTAEGTAAASETLAQIRVRSTLATLLEAGEANTVATVVCQLLNMGASGCPLVSAVGWEGLLNLDLPLHNLLGIIGPVLGLDADLAIGNYDAVLQAPINTALLGQALSLMAEAIPMNAPTASVLAAIGNGLAQLSIVPIDLTVGELLGFATGTPTEGLNVGVNALDMVLASVYAASEKCAVCANLDITVPLPAVPSLLSAGQSVGVKVKASVIEPAQFSSIGNPALAVMSDCSYGGPNCIYVNTSQVRVVATVALKGVTDLLGKLASVVLDLLGTILGLLEVCTNVCKTPLDLEVLPDDLSIIIKSAAAAVYVDDYACGIDGATKSLTVVANTDAARITLGKIADPQAALSSSAEPVAEKLTILRIPYTQYTCPNLGLCLLGRLYEAPNGKFDELSRAKAKRYDGEGGTNPALGIYLEPVLVEPLKDTQQHTFSAPADENLPRIHDQWPDNPSNPIKLDPAPLNLNLQLSLSLYCNAQLMSELTSTTCTAVSGLINLLTSGLSSIVNGVLSTLDPVVTTLFTQLGANLNVVEVGAKESCSMSGAILVN
mgnify:CR=1 FL=1